MSPVVVRLIRRVVPACLIAGLGSGAVAAASLDLAVTMRGAPLENAIVSLHSSSAAALVQPVAGEIDQIDFRFQPQALVVPVGSSVDFPNRDQILHHVYSFSSAKAFELPLYSGRPSSPVVFDTPGVVVLGCNIHDTMIGYVIVLDTPYHTRTDASGNARLEVPPGRYVLQVWHADQRHPADALRRDLDVVDEMQGLTIAVEPAVPISPPAVANDRVRALQKRFRALREPSDTVEPQQ